MKRKFPIDPLVGTRVGSLRILERLPDVSSTSKNLRAQVLVECDCGKRLKMTRYYLVRKPNPKTSCGCKEARQQQSKRTARFTIEYKPEYRSWRMMQQRCYNPTHVSYKDYGGRGITVCDLFRASFEAFLKHVGQRPSMKHTLDRIDPNGNYDLGNVKWSTPAEQGVNKRKTKA